MKQIVFLLGILLCVHNSLAQPQLVTSTPSDQRLSAFQTRQLNLTKSVVAGVKFENIGPSVMSGRVVDVDANPADPSKFIVAYASGSVWKTDNNGTTFSPIFDDQATPTIGDIAVDWAHNTIWVGTGENNSSRSSYAGTGIYKSTDGGKTWAHLGLADSHHIGRILLHPTNPNIAWVTAIGHLYSPNAERGVFKTVDGGKTWKKTLFIDENTGVIDLDRDPTNPNVLYAAAWYRTRRAWNFEEGGKTSGIYKSTDGGETWGLLTKQGSGFPITEGTGRIGLAVFDAKTVYAIMDNQDRRPDVTKPADAKPADTKANLKPEQFRSMSKEAFLALKKEDLKTYLEDNGFPREYTPEKVIEMIKNDTIQPVALADYLGDADPDNGKGPIIGAEVYRSDDGGKSWRKTHDGFLDSVFNTYGYYFGQIRVSPTNKDKIYVPAFPIIRSDDGGKTFKSIDGDNVHADHHALWINSKRDGHLINGNDGGLNISYDDGATWIKANQPSVGQFYYITVDMAQPYNVYGGLQDNGVWFGPNTNRESANWHDSGHYAYKGIGGGDGMQVQVDWRDNATVYSGSQFGFYSRQNLKTGERKGLGVRHKLGEKPLRFNWQTPILLSRHNQDILYYGANRLYRSMNKGDTFEAISDDLTNGGKVNGVPKSGDVPYGTLTAIDESALQFGLLVTGSDDGVVSLSKDGGVSWQNITKGLPEQLWVSRVRTSKFDKSTLYVALNGYRWDNFDAYVYKSNDLGKTWQRIGTDLPKEPVNVITEDPTNPKILYVGTDLGVYVTLDGGSTFMAMDNGLPHVPVHDLVVHPRENDLLVGTHGRSIYKGKVSLIQKLTPELMAKDLSLFPLDKVTFNERWGARGASWQEAFVPQMSYSLFAKQAGSIQVRIKDKDGKVLKSFTDNVKTGLNTLNYDLSADAGKKAADNGKFYLGEGDYSLEITMGNVKAEEKFSIKKREGGQGSFREEQEEEERD